MNKARKMQVAALAALMVTAVSSTVTAVEVIRMARNGFEVELSEDEASEAISAKELAEHDMKEGE
jgi:hypothetical protein